MTGKSSASTKGSKSIQGDSSACPEAVLGGLVTCEQADAVIQLAGDGLRAAVAGCLGLGGAAHDGEGGGARGRTRGRSGRWGRGGGKLGPPRPWQAYAQAWSGAM